jgi:hypothetical protein
VLLGGTNAGGTLSDTWTWDGSTWTALGSASPPRSHARMTFHRRLGALVVAGGLPSSAGIDLLVNRGGAWTPLPSPSEPPARYLTDIAYDGRRDVMVLFGGGAPTGSTLFEDTWEFDGATWRRVR